MLVLQVTLGDERDFSLQTPPLDGARAPGRRLQLLRAGGPWALRGASALRFCGRVLGGGKGGQSTIIGQSSARPLGDTFFCGPAGPTALIVRGADGKGEGGVGAGFRYWSFN